MLLEGIIGAATAMIFIIDFLVFCGVTPCSVMGYTLLLSLIEYKTLVMRGDLERANEILPSIPKEHHNRYVSPFAIFVLLKLVRDKHCCI